MRTVLVMRHAHAEARGVGGEDRDRPLSRAGRLEAILMGAYLAERLAERGDRLDYVVVSNAARACESYALMSRMIEAAPAPVVEPRLYTDAAEALLAALDHAPAEAATALLVGHHPSVDVVVATLAGDLVGAPAATACLTCIALGGDTVGCGRVLWRETPTSVLRAE